MLLKLLGACWDNVVVERFEEVTADVATYMKYYNPDRPHSVNGDMSPIEYENYQLKVSTWS